MFCLLGSTVHEPAPFRLWERRLAKGVFARKTAPLKLRLEIAQGLGPALGSCTLSKAARKRDHEAEAVLQVAELRFSH